MQQDELSKLIPNIPMRIALTDYCNLGCIGCNNEGLPPTQRNQAKITRLDELYQLIDGYVGLGGRRVEITGGDATLHPDVKDVLRHLTDAGLEQRLFHTNGIALDDEIIGILEGFTKIGISLHSRRFDEWAQITKGSATQYGRIMDNLRKMGEMGFGNRIEIKSVVYAGINDSPETVRSLLDLCAEYGFRFKFYVMEPQVPWQEAYRRENIGDLLQEAGAVKWDKTPPFRGQKSYLPFSVWNYGRSHGVLVNISCGGEAACEACYQTLPIHIKPDSDGTFYIKPCNVTAERVNLFSGGIFSANIPEAIAASREYLRARPGLGVGSWNSGISMASAVKWEATPYGCR